MAKVNHHQQQQKQEQQEQQSKQSQESLQQAIDVDELAREKVQEVEELLNSTVNLKPESINSWLSILKQIITAADLHRTNDKNDCNDNTKTKIEDESIYADYADDNEQFNAIDLTEQFASNSVKWTIRVKAFKVVHRIVQTFCNTNYRIASSKSSMLKHLPDLVRLSFIAATSPYDDLKIQGFEMFKFVIIRYASVEEREFPGHSILDQYRTQILSALKPAFNLDAPPYITAIASQVSSLWICKGLESEHSSLKRLCQLMMATIDKLENQSVNQNSKLYTESELEQERLNILGSWAQLYIKSKEYETNITFNESSQPLSSTISKFDTKLLYELIRPHISSLIDKWWEALKDYALLIMPAQRMPGICHDSEHVYTRDVALGLFAPVWPTLVLASTIWLCHDEPRQQSYNHDTPDDLSNSCDIKSDQVCDTRDSKKYLKFICGILMRELLRQSENQISRESLPESTIFVIRSLIILVENNEMKSAFVEDLTIAQEFYTALYAIFIKRTKNKSHHCNLLKNLLESIFNLVLNKIERKPGIREQDIDFLLTSTSRNLTMISEESEKGDVHAFDILRSNLTIRLTSIKVIIKTMPTLATRESSTRDAIINSFRAMICFDGETSVNLICLDHLKEILAIESETLVSLVVANTFDLSMAVVSKLCNNILNDKADSNEKSSTSSILLETYLKFARYAINRSRQVDRQGLVRSYMKTLLETISKLQKEGDSPRRALFGRRKEVFELGVRYLRDLNLTYESEFKTALDSELGETYEAIMAPKDGCKVVDSAKCSAQPQKKPMSSASGQPKQATKIVLKADFSNFYAKKT